MKKGFTLIELLAVIVILAVIAVIAIPIIMNIIEDSKREAAIASANGYVRAVNYKIAQETLNNREVDETVDYVIGENELAVTGNNMETITGSYVLSNSRVLWAGLCVNNYSVEYNATTGYFGISDRNFCGEELYEFIEPEAELMSNACSDESKYTSKSKFKIKTVEDLVCFSNLVNGGKNFAEKEIYLLSDVDISSDESYKDKNTTAYGDINGNGTVEGLKTELTTGAGFKPIGNNNNPFSGTFLGYAYTISNLMINRNTQNLGLFGYNVGMINGLKLRNINVTSTYTGTDVYAGGIVGKNGNSGNGTVKNVDVQGTVTSNTSGRRYYTGGIVGYNYGYLTSSIFKGNVTGYEDVGGIAGKHSVRQTNGVVYNSRITGVSCTGAISGTNDNNASGYSYNNAFPNNHSGADGISLIDFDMNTMDGILDTYIGGDNDSDGYYFDYDLDGNLTVFSTERSPIENKLKGEGTENSPYLLKNANDWKMASATIKDAKHYSLESNIDFLDDKFYALGTETNNFKGHINGNMNSISNISRTGHNYVSLFGINQGTIEALIISNVTINASGQYAGVIAGINNDSGIINGLKLRNINVTSTYTGADVYAGGIVGKNGNSGNGTVKNVDVQGTVTSNTSGRRYYTGGIVGYNYGYLTSSIFKGNVTGYEDVGGIAGKHSVRQTNGVVYNSRITGVSCTGAISGTKDNNASGYSYNNAFPNNNSGANGINLAYLNLSDMDGILDTYIGGDNDSDGYYFDYDVDGNITVFSTKKTPIVNTLVGSGTESDPYQINTANDWKIASATIGTAKNYVLNTDIDFSVNKFYALGTAANNFKGHINGKMHSINNISISGKDNVSLFGINKGTIEGIVFDNITVQSTGQYTGVIAGTNDSVINGVKLRNINVTSTYTGTDIYVGGAIGKNSSNGNAMAKNIDVQGTVTSNTSGRRYYTGGIVGYNYGYLTSSIFKGNVTGYEDVGGLVGKHSVGQTKGVVYNSRIAGNAYTGALSGTNDNNASGYSYNNAFLNNHSGKDGTTLTILTLEAVSSVLDINDSDHDGYYFGECNNSIVLLSKDLTPIGTDACIENIPTN